MFHCSTNRCCTVPPSGVALFHRLYSTVPPVDVPLFHHLSSTVPPSACNVLPSDVKVFWHQVFYCSTASAVGCFTVPPLDVLLFHCSTMCSSLRCSIVPPSLFYCFTMIVLLFHHQVFYCCTISVP